MMRQFTASEGDSDSESDSETITIGGSSLHHGHLEEVQG